MDRTRMMNGRMRTSPLITNDRLLLRHIPVIFVVDRVVLRYFNAYHRSMCSFLGDLFSGLFSMYSIHLPSPLLPLSFATSPGHREV